jgi:hypothetical protein
VGPSTRNAPGVYCIVDFSTNINPERGGFKSAQRELNAAELFIDCLLQKILSSAQTKGAWRRERYYLSVKLQHSISCVVENFVNCLGGCKKQRRKKKGSNTFDAKSFHKSNDCVYIQYNVLHKLSKCGQVFSNSDTNSVLPFTSKTFNTKMKHDDESQSI